MHTAVNSMALCDVQNDFHLGETAPPLPRTRAPRGWYNAPTPLLSDEVRSVGDGPGGLVLTYSVGIDEAGVDGVVYRTLEARWQSRRREVVGWARLGLLRCANPTLPNDVLSRAVSSQEASDLIATLSATYHGRVASLYTRTRHIASFTSLELREDFCGKDLGMRAGFELMQVVERRYGAGLFLFKPRPLPCEGPSVIGGTREWNAIPDLQYRRYRYRIARAAARHWGARKLPGSRDGMYVLGTSLAGTQVVSTRAWWYLR